MTSPPRPGPASTRTIDAAPRQPLDLALAYGREAFSFQGLAAGMSLWRDPDQPAFVAFRRQGRRLITAGAPVGPLESLTDVAARFVRMALVQSRQVAFFGVEQPALDRLCRLDGRWAWVKIGEQPVIDPSRWSLAGPRRRTVRLQVHRAHNHGVRLREARPEELAPGKGLRAAVDDLITSWRAERRMSPMGFLVDLHPFEYPRHRRYFIATRGPFLAGLLATAPLAHGRGHVAEELLRHPKAPNGTAEALLHCALETFRGEGATTLTFGLCALSGLEPGRPRLASRRGVPRWLLPLARWVFHHGNALYSFRGLWRFRQKFRPDRWEPVYLVVAPGPIRLATLVDVTLAFIPRALPIFAADTVVRLLRRRVRTVPLGLLAGTARFFGWALLPWIALLLAVDGPAAFGTSWLAPAWAVVDGVMAVAFLVLGRAIEEWPRLARSLSRVLLGAVATDALLTMLQAYLYNLDRLDGPAAALTLAIGTAAPLAALFFLSIVVLRFPTRPDASTS